MNDLSMMTIREVAALIERRKVSPVEVVRLSLERIEAMDSTLHTFITVRPEQALAEARVAENEILGGSYRGPLHGVPLGIKDNIAVSGWPTTNGSRLMAKYVTDYDATAVERLRQAGAIIVGKNNMHEWAMGSTSAGGPFGTVRNPWDLSRVSGGSSGGSAAAVSAALIYGSVGTDAKGSIRMPSSYCGVVGFKPTYGLVSRFGELPPSSSTNDHLGPITKDVTDAAIMMNALADYDPRDPSSIPLARRNYIAELHRGISGLRLGVPQNFFFDHAEPEVRALVLKAIDVLASLGAVVREVSMPSLRYMRFLDVCSLNECRSFLLPFGRRGPTAFADRRIWERVILSQFVRAMDAMKAAQLRNLMVEEFKAAMESADILAMPTTPTPAIPIKIENQESPNGVLGSRHDTDIGTILTYPLNLVGMPTISVPCGLTSDALPVGLMLAGRHGEDDVVLRAAHAYEQVETGGYVAPPSVRLGQ